MNEIKELQKEIDRLQMQALKQFEEKRIPNDKNHQRLVQLKKQLDRLLREENARNVVQVSVSFL